MEKRSGSSSFSRSIFRPGTQVWIKNPYPARDVAYLESWFENMSRPDYVPARVLSITGDQVLIQTMLDPSMEATIASADLYPMNESDEAESIIDVTDLLLLRHQHEPAVVYQVIKNASSGARYTFIGKLLLSCIVGNSSSESESELVLPHHRRNQDMTSSAKFSINLMNFLNSSSFFSSDIDDSLCICFRGVSGSGKSSSLKSVLYYYLTLDCLHNKIANIPILRQVQSVMMHSNEGNSKHAALLSILNVIEAYTTVSSVRNSNSSRCMKCIKLDYDVMDQSHDDDDDDDNTKIPSIVASNVSIGMLDTSRLISFARHSRNRESNNSKWQQSDSESNFLIFYYMLRGLGNDELNRLFLHPHILSYTLLNSNCDCCGSNSDYDQSDFLSRFHPTQWNKLKEALLSVGCTDNDIWSMIRCLSAILLLGNVEIASFENGCRIISSELMNQVNCLLLLNDDASGTDTLSFGLTHKVLEAAGKVTHVEVNSDEANLMKDSVCRYLYQKALDGIMNIYASSSKHVATASKHVCLLDSVGLLFGNSSPKFNSLSAGVTSDDLNLIIGSLYEFNMNYYEERLCQIFMQSELKVHFQDMMKEGLDVSSLSSSSGNYDNLTLLSIYDKPNLNLFSLLDEVSCLPRSSDSSYLSKIQSNFKRSNVVVKSPRCLLNCFSVCHSQNQVVHYDVCGFLDLNKHKLSMHIESILSSSSTSSSSSSVAGRRSSFSSSSSSLVTNRFKTDFARLMSLVENASVQLYVMNINPSDVLNNNRLSPSFILSQLTSLSIMDFIKKHNNGFSIKYTYHEFVKLFGITSNYYVTDENAQADYFKDACRHILADVWKLLPRVGSIDSNVKFGDVHLFLRGRLCVILKQLSADIANDKNRAAVSVQTCFKRNYYQHRFHKMQKGVNLLQAIFKGRLLSRELKVKLNAFRLLVHVFRKFVIRRRYLKNRQCIEKIQRRFKNYLSRIHWMKMRRGIRGIHSLMRTYMARVYVSQVTCQAMFLQSACRQYIDRNRGWQIRLQLALRLQALYRGFKCRQEHGHVSQHLSHFKKSRVQVISATVICARWKGLLVRRRFTQILHALALLQHWIRGVLIRHRYMKMKVAVIWLQSSARGMIGRLKYKTKYIAKMLELEQEKLRLVRDRELVSLARIHAQQVKADLTLPESEISHHVAVFDIDLIVDPFEPYPGGWSNDVYQLNKSLINSRNRRLIDVCVGGSHSVCLDDGGDVYSWGWGFEGELGHVTHANERSPRMIETMQFLASSLENKSRVALLPSSSPSSRVRISQCAAGQDFALALTDHGRVISWGSNKQGQLGHGNFKQNSLPRPIETIKRVITGIACGQSHSVMLSDSGIVYSCGYGPVVGTLLQSNDDISTIANQVDVCEPAVVKSISRIKIKQIACGIRHTVCLTSNGHVISWGSNDHGQLGHNDHHDYGYGLPEFVWKIGGLELPADVSTDARQSSRYLTCVDLNKYQRVLSVSCGGRHSLVITSTGRMYGWGWNKFGQVCCDNGQTCITTPYIIGLLRDHTVLEIGCGWRHSLCLNDKNQVYYWGYGCSNQNTTQDSTLTPIRIPIPERRHVIGFSSSWSQTLSASVMKYKIVGPPRVAEEKKTVEVIVVAPSPIKTTGSRVSKQTSSSSLFSDKSIQSMSSSQLKEEISKLSVTSPTRASNQSKDDGGQVKEREKSWNKNTSNTASHNVTSKSKQPTGMSSPYLLSGLHTTSEVVNILRSDHPEAMMKEFNERQKEASDQLAVTTIKKVQSVASPVTSSKTISSPILTSSLDLFSRSALVNTSHTVVFGKPLTAMDDATAESKLQHDAPVQIPVMMMSKPHISLPPPIMIQRQPSLVSAPTTTIESSNKPPSTTTAGAIELLPSLTSSSSTTQVPGPVPTKLSASSRRKLLSSHAQGVASKPQQFSDKISSADSQQNQVIHIDDDDDDGSWILK